MPRKQGSVKAPSPHADVPIAEREILYGAEDIGKLIDATPNRAFYLLEQKRLPAFKIGNIWAMRPAAWRAWCAAQEAKAGEAAA
jgi:hypothetical protein